MYSAAHRITLFSTGSNAYRRPTIGIGAFYSYQMLDTRDWIEKVRDFSLITTRRLPLLRVPRAAGAGYQDSGDRAGSLRSCSHATLRKELRYVGLDHQQAGRQKQRQDSRKCQAARYRR